MLIPRRSKTIIEDFDDVPFSRKLHGTDVVLRFCDRGLRLQG